MESKELAITGVITYGGSYILARFFMGKYKIEDEIKLKNHYEILKKQINQYSK